MRITIVLALAACVIAVPGQKAKRQDNLSQLLELASEAGITALPTDPAVLLSLGPIANQLASELPTAPVLSVLMTAAPTGFISEILHNPSFASSWESAFAAGTPPGWFSSLPTDVKSYLHTYSGYAPAATEVAEIAALTNATTTGGAFGPAAPSGSTDSGSMTTSMTGTQSGARQSVTTTMTVAAGPETSTYASTNSHGGFLTTTTSSAMAAETAVLGLGLAGVVGMLGLAAAL
ncbi:hypothetical protein MMC18_001456 [Xylographa bjoerkii]|nr:hypothetical protein [Xylographa bjoerkii]